MNFYKNIIFKRSNFLFVCIATIISALFLVLAGCSGGDDNSPGQTEIQTPQVSDFVISGLGTFTYDGLAKEVTITPKSGKSNGKITIYYNGSSTKPSQVGFYPVTFDVGAAQGWSAVSGLEAGNITINDGSDRIITQLTADKWTDGNIADTDGQQWFKFTATAVTQYIHFSPGTLQGISIQLYNNNETAVGSIIVLDSGTTYTSRTVTSGSEYYIKVTSPYSDGGTYNIGFSASTTPPSSVAIPANAPVLTAATWTDGNIVSGGQQWFKFTATSATQYIHFNPGTLQNVNIQLFDNTGLAIGDQLYYYVGSSSGSRQVTAGNEYYIRITPSYGDNRSGTFKIGFSASYTPPAILPANFTTLSLDKWADGNIADTDGQQWFKFTATAATQYIHFAPASLQNAYIQLYDNTGANIGDQASLSSGTGYFNRSVTSGNEYYIKVTSAGYGDNRSGTYEIGFTTSTTMPLLNIPTSNVTQLTADIQVNGNIADSSGQQWFKFTATAATQYIYFDPGTLNEIFVQICDSTGKVEVKPTRLYGTNLSAVLTATTGEEYYIRVMPYGGGGAYKIKFSASLVVVLPTSNVIQLTADTWANGSIISSNSNGQWFKFTATVNGYQYIHFESDTLGNNTVYVQIYDGNGTAVGSRVTFNSSAYTSITVTTNSVYYINVTPYYSSGTYKIGFNTAIALPSTNITQLTAGKWADGNIASSGGQQWFKFTATASNQYIYFDPGTLSSVYIQLYNSNGTTSGSQGSLSSSTIYISRTVTSGNEYYIKVTPSYYDNSGTYEIGVTSSASTIPTLTVPSTATSLTTINAWVNGNITAPGGDQWFRFTASGSQHYIYFDPGTLNEVLVQICDSTGKVAVKLKKLYDTNPVVSLLTTTSETYYIRVMPYGGSGTYKISYGTLPLSPNANVSELTVDTWTNGSITSSNSNGQWFKFKATNSTQYIHFEPGTLSEIYVQLYDSNGIAVGTQSNLYSSNKYTSKTVTSNNDYYINVTTAYNSYAGTYKIGFTTSSTAPALP